MEDAWLALAHEKELSPLTTAFTRLLERQAS